MPSCGGCAKKRSIVWPLTIALSMATTATTAIWPIFAKRLGELGAGADSLGLMTALYALAAVTISPIAGTLGDRFGRRPLLLAALAGLAATSVAYLSARSVAALMALRVLEGAFTAGLSPTTMGMISDLAPEKERSRWAGLAGGGASVGWVVGPALGGLLYDLAGSAAPFIGSALMALAALGIVAVIVPESVAGLNGRRPRPLTGQAARLTGPLTRHSRTLALFLVLTFVDSVTWGFVEPRLMFHVYDDLGWAAGLFGTAVSAYGVGLVLGGMFLGHLADRWGRRPVLCAALALHAVQYAGFVLTESYLAILMTQSLAGTGEALVNAALTAGLMDITPERRRGRVMGIRYAAYSLGSVAGPLLGSLTARRITARQAFTVSGLALVAGAGLVLTTIRRLPAPAKDGGPVAGIRS